MKGPRMQIPWHLLADWQVEAWLETSVQFGLSNEVARQRLVTFGGNRISEAKAPSAIRLFILQFKDFMVLVLLIAAALSCLIGDAKDSITILVILFLNAFLGFVQEYRAAKAVESLHTLSTPFTKVRRTIGILSISSYDLVPGDVVFLESGNIVPADIRLTEATRLFINESILTGESVSVSKSPEGSFSRSTSIGDRRNMVFKGTVVASGRGQGIVVATGENTELGEIAEMTDMQVTHVSPLQHRLNRFGGLLSLWVLAICILVLWLGLAEGKPLGLMLMTAISLAVAAIPEALPAIATIALALGAVHMARRKALVKRLHAVEALGSVTCICTDKTGTLTENRMSAERFVLGDQPTQAPDWSLQPEFRRALALNNDAVFGASATIQGEAMETALLQSTHLNATELQTLKEQYPRIDELPFDSDRMRMTTIHRDGGGCLSITKGAPEVLLPRCTRINGNVLTSRMREDILNQAKSMASDGMRVICFSQNNFDCKTLHANNVESDLSLLGMVGLIDPPRPESALAIERCKTAGITPIMITGDHPETARAIGSKLGITRVDGRVMTGTEMDVLDEREFQKAVSSVCVFARVSPAQKRRIITALQSRGELVAMTGDGVNDAPALKSADIGIAMGMNGTDVAREAAPMILLDNNFATIVAAIEEGRRVYDNIRKFIRYALTCNTAEMICLLFAPILGLPLPLFPIQILWINLITDGIPGIALAFEPAEEGLMASRPRAPSQGLLGNGMWQKIGIYGLLMAGASLSVQAYAYWYGIENWQTMLFVVLSLSQLAHIMALRSERTTIFKHGFFSNPILLTSVLGTFFLQLCAIYVPWFNEILDTHPLNVEELSICLAVASCMFFIVEFEKIILPSMNGSGNQKGDS